MCDLMVKAWLKKVNINYNIARNYEILCLKFWFGKDAEVCLSVKN